MRRTELLESTVSEYGKLLESAAGTGLRPWDTDRLAEDLSRGHDWTSDGARTIVALASEYGAFMLRNALALAIVLDKEDGDLGF